MSSLSRDKYAVSRVPSPSARIYEQYQRTVADVPCAGRNVILALTVRKFICRTPGCPRKIFTERLPGLVQS
ncbi:MAG: transposase family protein [Ktedonobacteraceae bacterium]